MKRTIIRIIAVGLLILASGAVPVVAGGPVPACYPNACQPGR